MTRTARVASIFVLSVLLVVGSGITGAAYSSTTIAQVDDSGDAAATLVVDDDGGADYTSIQAAIDAADPGDTVEVRPGEYSPELVLDKSLELTAPDGATLNGSKADGFVPTGITIPEGSSAAPMISGFNITGYFEGINASDTQGAVTIADTTVHDSFSGFSLQRTDGAWQLDDVTMKGNLAGLVASNATSDWSVTGSTNNGSIIGIAADNSTGDWSVSDTLVERTAVGIAAGGSGGQWVLDNVTVSLATGPGVVASGSSGAWTIRDSVITNVTTEFAEESSFLAFPGIGILANETTGAWSVTNTEITDIQNESIDATGASPAGDATGNWWGQAGGPESGDCIGNVDCGQQLSSPPSGTPDDPSDIVLPGQSEPAGNLDSDPQLEDVNGDGQGNIFDAIALYNNRNSDAVQQNADKFNFDGNGGVNLFDAIALYNEVSG